MKMCNICKTEKELDEFHKKGKGHQGMCKECRKNYIREHYLKNKEKYLEKAKISNKKLRDWYVDLKSKLSCESCGESHISCLDFHHKNPKEKEIALGSAMSYSKEKVNKELEKCIVLCSNCHRKLHWNERNNDM